MRAQKVLFPVFAALPMFLTAALLTASGDEAPVVAASPLTTLTPEQHDLVWNMQGDPEPEVRNAYRKENEGQHFTTCDELNLHLFEPAVRNVGGAYVGVGSDQAYIFMGWARSEVGWMIDYDPLVIQIHGIYRVFFMAAETPQQFLHFWTREGADEARDAIRRLVAYEPAAAVILQTYNSFRDHINLRLRQSLSLMRKAGVDFYLNDEGDYAHVRAMVMTGRARPMLANLLGDRGMGEIGDASRGLGVPIRVVYLSNVEDYWSYGDAYIANLRKMNFDERSQVLRTLASKKSNGDYRYVLQGGLNLLKWLDSGRVKRTRSMFPKGAIRKSEEVQLVTIDHEPPGGTGGK